jgi:hypothetical protein
LAIQRERERERVSELSEIDWDVRGCWGKTEIGGRKSGKF